MTAPDPVELDRPRFAQSDVPPPPPAEMPKGRAPQVAMVCWGSFMALSNGSHQRVAALLDALRSRFEHVAVYSYRDHVAEPWSAAHIEAFKARFPGTDLILDRETRALKLSKKVKEALVTLFPGAAARILALRIPGQAPGYQALTGADQPPLVVNYVDGLARLNGVDCARVVVETHDVKFVKRAKMSQISSVARASLLRLRNEIASLAAAQGVVAITRAEASFFRMMLGANAKHVFDISIYKSSAKPFVPSQSYSYDMLFTASENPLNERGFLSFLDRNADWIADYRIALCGRICESTAIQDRIAGMANVTALGFVDDLDALFGETKVCLSPTDGTGLKIKIVEALSHGKPVFASQHSIEGLAPGHTACVFPITAELCRPILDNTAALQEASRAAAAYYQSFAADGDSAAFLDFLDDLVTSETGKISQ